MRLFNSYQSASNHGFSLIELMVAMAVVGIFLGAVFVTFTNFLGESANQASLSAQSLDVRTGLNQVRRDLASAGLGIPEDGSQLDNAVTGNQSSVRIRSTGVTGRDGDNGNRAGKVGVLQSGPSAQGIPGDATGVVLTPAREYITAGELQTLNPSLKTTKLFFVTQLSPNEFYERTYALSSECDSGSNPCGDCADGTADLQYQDASGNSGRPVVECVADFRLRYGFQTSGGGIDFTSTSPGNPPAGIEDTYPDVLKVGMVVQVGGRYRNEVRTESPVSYADSDLQTGDGVTLSDEQKQYRWKVVEWTVPLTNMP